MPSHLEERSDTSVPFLVGLFHSLCLLSAEVQRQHPRLSNAYVEGTLGAARGARIPLRPTALNVSAFSLPESYEGCLNHLPSLCALALAGSNDCQDLSANGEAAADARDKLVVGEGER